MNVSSVPPDSEGLPSGSAARLGASSGRETDAAHRAPRRIGRESMSEIHGTVGSYVVNALDAEELEEFEAHLAVCSTCTREVQEFSEMAAEFIAARATQPPPRTTQGSLRPT